MLNAVGTCKSFSNNIFLLLETTISHYFRQSGKNIDWFFYQLSFILKQNDNKNEKSYWKIGKFTESQKEVEEHSPSWRNVLERLGPTLPSFELQQMFDGEHLLCIYISMIYKLKDLRESGKRITYLQNIGKMLENYKSK